MDCLNKNSHFVKTVNTTMVAVLYFQNQVMISGLKFKNNVTNGQNYLREFVRNDC